MNKMLLAGFLSFVVLTGTAGAEEQGMCPQMNYERTSPYHSPQMGSGCPMMSQSCPCPGFQGKKDAWTDKDRPSDLTKLLYKKTKFMLRHSQELGLQQDQIEKIKTVLYAAKKRMILQAAQLQVIDIDIMQEIAKDETVLKAASELINKKHELEKQQAQEALKNIMEVKQLLTQEQRAALKQMMMNPSKKVKQQKTRSQAQTAE